MNIFTEFARQILIKKNILIQLFKKLNLSNKFINEFYRNHIYIDDNIIRQKMHLLCKVTQIESFQDLFCHEDGIQFVFHTTPHEYRFIRFRISFDIKILAISLLNQQQNVQFLINNIQIKALNHLSKPFRFCIQVKETFSISCTIFDWHSIL
jgi:hypothetical protein